MTKRVNIAIFISGRGSNMIALLAACKSSDFPALPVLVLSNHADAPGLLAAEQAGIVTATLIRKEFTTREAYDMALNETLKAHDVELICLAGFMQLLSRDFVETWRDRLINIHPSLLPSFKGLNTHARTLEAGVKFSGCTVHFVRHEMDTGPIIAQAVVPVMDEDTPDTLATRILAAEHRIYPHALRLVASGDVRVDGERLISTTGKAPAVELPTLISPVIEG